jgi:glutamate 5-kinase
MIHRSKLKECKRIVVKVGTSSITYDNGRANLKNIEKLCCAISDQMNQGHEMILVSSGAIGIGMGRLRLDKKPETIREKQAVAAVGQCELMNLYSKFFSEYSYVVGQILLTRDDIEDGVTKENICNTFECLIEKEIVPIVNENDTVSTKEIYHNGTFGDNDTLSAMVASLIKADLLILLSDISGLYDCDPKQNPDAKLIDTVVDITPEVIGFAGDVSSNRGTGGMRTKIEAARIATDAGIHMIIANGQDPSIIKSIMSGEMKGTMFVAK